MVHSCSKFKIVLIKNWVPELHEHRKCTGFTYCGAKIFNSLPIKTRETQYHFQKPGEELDMG